MWTLRADVAAFSTHLGLEQALLPSFSLHEAVCREICKGLQATQAEGPATVAGNNQQQGAGGPQAKYGGHSFAKRLKLRKTSKAQKRTAPSKKTPKAQKSSSKAAGAPPLSCAVESWKACSFQPVAAVRLVIREAKWPHLMNHLPPTLVQMLQQLYDAKVPEEEDSNKASTSGANKRPQKKLPQPEARTLWVPYPLLPYVLDKLREETAEKCANIAVEAPPCLCCRKDPKVTQSQYAMSKDMSPEEQSLLKLLALKATTPPVNVVTETYATQVAQRGLLKSLCRRLHHAYEGGAYPTLHRPTLLAGERRVAVSSADVAPHQVVLDRILASQMAVYQELFPNTHQIDRARDDLCQVLATRRRTKILWNQGTRQGSWPVTLRILKDPVKWSEWCECQLRCRPSCRMWYQRPLGTGDLILVKRSPENAGVAPLVLEAKVSSVSLPMNNIKIHAATMASLALQGDFDGDQLVVSSMSLDPLSRDPGFVLAAADFGGCRLRKLPGLYAVSASLLLEPSPTSSGGQTYLHELLANEATMHILNKEERSGNGKTCPEPRVRSHVTQTVLPLLSPLLKQWPGSAGALYSLWEQAFGPWAAQSLWAQVDGLSCTLAARLPPVSVMSLIGLTPGREWLVRFVQYVGYKVAQEAPAMYREELAQHVGEVAAACGRLYLEEAHALASALTPCLQQDQTAPRHALSEPHSHVTVLLKTLQKASADPQCYSAAHCLLESIQRLRIAHRGLLGYPVNLKKGTIGWKEGDTNPYGTVSNTNTEAVWAMLGPHFTHRGDVGRRFMRQITADVRRLSALRQHPVLGCFTVDKVVVGTLETINAYRGLPLPRSALQRPKNFVHVPLACHRLDGPLRPSCTEDLTKLTVPSRAYFWSGLQHQGLAFVEPLAHMVELWRSTKQSVDTDYEEVWVVYLNDLMEVPEWLPGYNTVLLGILQRHSRLRDRPCPAHLVVCTAAAKPSAASVESWQGQALPCGCLSLLHDERMMILGHISGTWAGQLRHFKLHLPETHSALVPLPHDHAAVFYQNGTASVMLQLKPALPQNPREENLHDLRSHLIMHLLHPIDPNTDTSEAALDMFTSGPATMSAIGEWSFKLVPLGAIFGLCPRFTPHCHDPVANLMRYVEKPAVFKEMSIQDVLNLLLSDILGSGLFWGASHAAAWSPQSPTQQSTATSMVCPRCGSPLRQRLCRENDVAGSSKVSACYTCEDHTTTSLPRAVRQAILHHLDLLHTRQSSQTLGTGQSLSDFSKSPSAMVILGFDLDQSQIQPREVLQLAGLLAHMAPDLQIKPLVIADGFCFFLCLGHMQMLRNDLLQKLHMQGQALRLCPPSLWHLPVWSQCRTTAISSHQLLLEGTANYKATTTHGSAAEVARDLSREARKLNITVPGSNAGSAITLPEKLVNGDVLSMPLYDILALALVQKQPKMQLGVALRLGKDAAMQRSLRRIVEQARAGKTTTYTRCDLLGPKATWCPPRLTASSKAQWGSTIGAGFASLQPNPQTPVVGVFQRERMGMLLQTMAWIPAFGLCMRGQLFVICELLRHGLCPLEIQDHPDLKPMVMANRMFEWTSQRLSAALGIHHLGTLSLHAPTKDAPPFVATSRALIVAAVLLMLQRRSPQKYRNDLPALIRDGQACFTQWLTRDMTPVEQELLPSMCVSARRHALVLPSECLQTLVPDVARPHHKRKAICLDD
jgi:hypothetical protein